MRIIFILIFLVTIGITAYASGEYDSVIYTKRSDIALAGYDTVSFFLDESPEKGNKKWQTEFRNAVWYFRSEKNLNLFKDNPKKYAPAYGGYCAWAMNDGKLAPGKPKYWDIIDGRLYLNFSASTRRKFLAEVESMIKNADSKWPGIETELAEKQN